MIHDWFIASLITNVFLLAIWCLSMRSRDSYLIAKAEPKNRTAMCVRGKFYYVIPEPEYIARQSEFYKISGKLAILECSEAKRCEQK